MTTYRVGTHHGVTICAEGDGARCARPGHDCARGHLVGVVVDGGQDFAERICRLLNADEAASDGMTQQEFEEFRASFLRAVHEDAPPAPLSEPQAAQNASGVGRDANDAPKSAESECDCGLTPCPIAEIRIKARALGYRLELFTREHDAYKEPR